MKHGHSAIIDKACCLQLSRWDDNDAARSMSKNSR